MIVDIKEYERELCDNLLPINTKTDLTKENLIKAFLQAEAALGILFSTLNDTLQETPGVNEDELLGMDSVSDAMSDILSCETVLHKTIKVVIDYLESEDKTDKVLSFEKFNSALELDPIWCEMDSEAKEGLYEKWSERAKDRPWMEPSLPGVHFYAGYDDAWKLIHEHDKKFGWED